MAWCRSGNKPSSEPMLIQFGDIYLVLGEMSNRTNLDACCMNIFQYKMRDELDGTYFTHYRIVCYFDCRPSLNHRRSCCMGLYIYLLKFAALMLIQHPHLIFPLQKLWSSQWSNEQVVTLFCSLPYFDMTPTTIYLYTWFPTRVHLSSYIHGCVAMVAIAGTYTGYGLFHCDLWANQAPVDFICGLSAFKWMGRLACSKVAAMVVPS